LPKNADFLRFFWVSTISRDWNQETLERLYRTKRNVDDTFMRSIHSGFSWVFAGISNPADTTDRARSAVRATMARLASRRRSVEPRRHEKCFSATPNDGPSQPGGPQAAHEPRDRRDGKSAVALCLSPAPRTPRPRRSHQPRPMGPLTPVGPRSTALAGLRLDALALASRSIVVHNY